MDEQSIFLKALEMSSPEAQAAWLDQACDEDGGYAPFAYPCSGNSNPHNPEAITSPG